MKFLGGNGRQREREASEMHKRDEIMVGKERRAKCRERVGVIVLCSQYRLLELWCEVGSSNIQAEVVKLNILQARKGKITE